MSWTIYINQYVTGRKKTPVTVTHWLPAFALLVHSSKYQVVIAAMMPFSGHDTHLQYLKRGRQMCRPLIITPLICPVCSINSAAAAFLQLVLDLYGDPYSVVWLCLLSTPKFAFSTNIQKHKGLSVASSLWVLIKVRLTARQFKLQ